MFLDGMNNAASPRTVQGFAPRDVRNIEYWPPGAARSRRGFRPYLTNHTTPSTGVIRDLYPFARFVGDTWKVDLVARVISGSTATLKKVNIWNGSAEVRSGTLATMSTANWTEADIGGQFFHRDGYLYYSDGTTHAAWEQASTPLTVGLTAATGPLHYKLHVSGEELRKSRIEPGYYDWTIVSKHSGRNVRSPPMGFQVPGTLIIIGGEPPYWNTYYSLVAIPNVPCAINIAFSSLTLDAAADQMELYRRHPFTQFFKPARRIDDVRMVTRLASTASSYTDRLNDTELGDRLTFAGSPAPAWLAAAQVGQRYWYMTPTAVYFSELDSPENVAQEIEIDGHQWKPFLQTEARDHGATGEAKLPLPASAGRGQAILAVGDTVVALCSQQTLYVGGGAPSQFGLHILSEDIGCVAPRAAIVTPHGAFWLAQQGIIHMPVGGRPTVISRGYLDFDDWGSGVHLNRANLGTACACYDPATETVEFAVRSFSGVGNDTVIALTLGQGKPKWARHEARLEAASFGAECVTSMTTVHLPNKEPFVVYGTSRNRILCRSGSQDQRGASGYSGVPWEISGWLGQEHGERRKSNIGVFLACKYAEAANILVSAWSRRSLGAPNTDEVPQTATTTITCSSAGVGYGQLGVAGAPYLYVGLGKTTSTVFEIHDLGFYAASDDQVTPPEGKRIG